MSATPATKALDAQNIPYRVFPYDHDPAAESFGLEAAEVLGLDPDCVFKTLLATLDTDELVVAIVPVSGRLDLKALARHAGAKRATMADPGIAEKTTGYVVGGISPIGQRKQLRTFVDETAEVVDEIYVSGGRRGFDLGLKPSDLLAATHAIAVPLAI